MNTELRKRLEEAAYKIKCDIVDEDPQEIYCNAIEKGAIRGIELGYKEAIVQAKKWLRYNVHRYIYAINEDGIPQAGIGAANFSADFESYMNKLWEEKK